MFKKLIILIKMILFIKNHSLFIISSIKIIIYIRMNLAFKVFLLSLLIVYSFSLKGIGLNPIKPYNSNQGKSTSYLFMITPEE